MPRPSAFPLIDFGGPWPPDEAALLADAVAAAAALRGEPSRDDREPFRPWSLVRVPLHRRRTVYLAHHLRDGVIHRADTAEALAARITDAARRPGR